MSKPNIKVVIALFESYLSLRKADWNFELLPNGNVKLPDDESWEGKKVAVCNDLLQKIFKFSPNSKENDIEQWRDLIHDLHEQELNQHDLYYKKQWFGKTHCLLDLIRAIRGYIITCLKTEDKFKKYEAGLRALQIKHESDVLRLEKHTEGHNPNELETSKIDLARTNKELQALKIEGEPLNDFFVDQIKPHDPLYQNPEATIETFKKNAEASELLGVLCSQVVSSKQKITQRIVNDNNAVQPATLPTPATVTATVAVAPATASTTPPKSEGLAALGNYEKTPSPAVTTTQTAKPPRAPRAVKSGQRSALLNNSQFAGPASIVMDDEELPAYNLRSKTNSSRRK